MARICNCHKNRAKAVARGMDWHAANLKYSKPGYHEHRCECTCGCKQDTGGYGYCPSCHFAHAKMRNETIGILGLPFKNDG